MGANEGRVIARLAYIGEASKGGEENICYQIPSKLPNLGIVGRLLLVDDAPQGNGRVVQAA